MEKKYTKMSTIRGTRYAIELTKRVKGIPGFAPEYRDRKVCDVVFRFPHGDGETYVQFTESPPVLDFSDVKQILETFEEPFVEDNFKFEEKE